MISNMEMRAIDQATRDADARNQLAQLSQDIVVRDDVLDSDTRGQATALGFGSQRTKATNDADRYIKMYHAYDDREVSLPAYMAPNRLTLRFVQGDQEVPPEFWGKQVWLLANDPNRRPPEKRTYQCRLSVRASAEHLVEIQKAGLTPNCRIEPKGGGFQTQFQADEHFRIKHPRRWTAFQRSLASQQSTSAADTMKEAIKELVAGLRAPAPEPVPAPVPARNTKTSAAE